MNDVLLFLSGCIVGYVLGWRSGYRLCSTQVTRAVDDMLDSFRKSRSEL